MALRLAEYSELCIQNSIDIGAYDDLTEMRLYGVELVELATWWALNNDMIECVLNGLRPSETNETRRLDFVATDPLTRLVNSFLEESTRSHFRPKLHRFPIKIRSLDEIVVQLHIYCETFQRIVRCNQDLWDPME